MNIENLVGDIDTLCDEEAALGSTGHLASVRYVLEQLASYVARREQGIEARTAGDVETASGIETRADAHIHDIGIDASGMERPVQASPAPTRRLMTLDDAPTVAQCDMCGGLGLVKVDPCDGQPERLETCGICEGDGYRTLDEQDAEIETKVRPVQASPAPPTLDDECDDDRPTLDEPQCPNCSEYKWDCECGQGGDEW